MIRVPLFEFNSAFLRATTLLVMKCSNEFFWFAYKFYKKAVVVVQLTELNLGSNTAISNFYKNKIYKNIKLIKIDSEWPFYKKVEKLSSFTFDNYRALNQTVERRTSRPQCQQKSYFKRLKSFVGITCFNTPQQFLKWGQWLWHCWQSGCFRHKRSAVWFKSSEILNWRLF